MTAAEYAERMAKVRESVAKVAKANRPRNQTVKQPPINERVAVPHAFMGIRA